MFSHREEPGNFPFDLLPFRGESDQPFLGKVGTYFFVLLWEVWGRIGCMCASTSSACMSSLEYSRCILGQLLWSLTPLEGFPFRLRRRNQLLSELRMVILNLVSMYWEEHSSSYPQVANWQHYEPMHDLEDSQMAPVPQRSHFIYSRSRCLLR